MNTPLTIVLFCLLISPCLKAQDRGKEPGANSVLEAIQQFKSQHTGKPNEVTVVLDPPEESSSKKPEKKKSGDPPLPPLIPRSR